MLAFFKNSFSRTPNCFILLGVKRAICITADIGGPNHKSHAMTSSQIFKKGTFCEAKVS